MTTLTITQPRATLKTWVDRVVLWVPYEETPRFLAFGLIMLRQVTLPFFLLILLLPINALLRNHPLAAMTIGLGAFVVFEELGRYSFVRRAEKPIVALITFTLLTIILESALYFQKSVPLVTNLAIRAPSWCVHIAAACALYAGLKQRRFLPAIILGLMILHTAFNVSSATYFAHRSAASFIGLPGNGTESLGSRLTSMQRR